MTEAGYAAVGTLVGVSLSAVVAGILKLWDARHRYRAADRASLDAEYDRFLARHQADYDRLDARYREQQDEIELIVQRERALELRHERALARISYLEEALERASIPFRRWNPDPSDTIIAGPPPPPGGPHDRPTGS